MAIAPFMDPNSIWHYCREGIQLQYPDLATYLGLPGHCFSMKHTYICYMRQLQYSNLAKNLWLKNYGLLHRGLLRLTHVAKKYLLNIIPFIIKQPRPFTLRLVLVAAVLGFGLHFGLGLTPISAVFITGIILSSFFFVAILLSPITAKYLLGIIYNRLFLGRRFYANHAIPYFIRFSWKYGFTFCYKYEDVKDLLYTGKV